ncbi:hypothetical protein [Ferruginibacter sp.]
MAATVIKYKDKEKEKAINLLMHYNSIVQKGQAFQSTFNIAADYMRLFLGEHSNIYQSFKQLDTRDKSEPELQKELSMASEFLQAAAQYIAENGVYKDLQLQLLQLQIKDSKRKWIIGVSSAIGGALLANAKDILNYLL